MMLQLNLQIPQGFVVPKNLLHLITWLHNMGDVEVLAWEMASPESEYNILSK